MGNPNDLFDELKALAATPARRVRPDAAAKYVGYSVRALEDWRRSWRVAEQEGKPELRRGPKFIKIGKRVLYEVRELDEWKASGMANLSRLSPEDSDDGAVTA